MVYDLPVMHYGVKGMKWGIRRSQEQLDAARGEKVKRKEERQRRKQVRKNRRILSDDELKKEVDRLSLEKKYRDLSDSDLNPGRSAVSRFLKSSGGRVATSAAIGSLAYLGYSAMTGRFDVNRAADYMFPNPNRKK